MLSARLRRLTVILKFEPFSSSYEILTDNIAINRATLVVP